MPSKNRQELYDLFVTGSKPTQDDFADLIDSMVNSADDGIGAAEKGEPMEIVQQGAKDRLLDFSKVKGNPVWRVGAQADGNNGLNIATADEKSRVFIRKENGCIGINNSAPQAKLHVTPESDTALQVDNRTGNPVLVVENNNISIGATVQEGYQLTVGGKVDVKDNAVFEGSLAVSQGMNVSNGAVIQTGKLEAKEGIKANAGLTLESGKLDAKDGLTVNGGALVQSGTLEVKGGMTVAGGLLLENGPLEVMSGMTVAGGLVVDSGMLEVKENLKVDDGLTIAGGRLEAKEGFTANGGLVVETGMLEAKEGIAVRNGLVLEIGRLEAKKGLTVNDGALIETGKLEVREGLAVDGGLMLKSGQLETKDGLIVNGGASIKTGKLDVKEGITVSEGLIVENGQLAAKNGLTVDGGAVVSTGKLQAYQGVTVNAGLAVESGTLEAKSGMLVRGAARVEEGVLTANGGLLVAGGSTFSAPGPVLLGNTTDGAVTINGVMQAAKGLTVSGAPLMAENGLNITGDLNVSANSIMNSASITSLNVNEIKVSGHLALESVNFSSLTVANGDISNLKSGNVDVSGTCKVADNVTFDSGRLYVTYDGVSSVKPKLLIKEGTVTGETGDFGIAVDDNKVVTIIYNTDSTINNFIKNWETYQEDYPDKAAGFEFLRVGASSWDLRDQEISLAPMGIYKEYIVVENGLRIINTQDGVNPQFVIKAKGDTSDGFGFEINGSLLTITYPANQDICTVEQLIADWRIWLSDHSGQTGGFEIGKTPDATGELLVTEVATTSLAANAAGNIFNKVMIKTNTVRVNGQLQIGDSDVFIGNISNSETLAENSDANLVTERAVKTYVDKGFKLKADLEYVNGELDKKAMKVDLESTKADLANTKTDLATTKTNLANTVTDLTSTKTDLANTKTDLATTKTNLANTVTDLTSTKTDLANTKTDLATTKTNLTNTVADLTSVKTDLTSTKADLENVEGELDQKAAISALATKTDLSKADGLSVGADGQTVPVGTIVFSGDSRGVLIVEKAVGSSLTAGLFAVHGMDRLIKIAGDEFTDQQGSDGKFNVYFVAQKLMVENKSSGDVMVNVSYLGI